MSWIRRATRRTVHTAAVATVLIGLSSSSAAAAADDDYVKYYVVTAERQGKPENLTEIAGRFLADGSRSAELFSLNSGRRQPDGGALSDPAKLSAGWMLELPWDAYGAGVRYGVLPVKASAAVRPVKPSQQNRGKPQSTQGGDAGSGTKPGSARKPGKPSKPGDCAIAAASSSRSQWADLRLAADQAWPQSRGKGQLVAIVDSGVDGGLPQLNGHVALGTDVVTGSGRGDTDCLGTGTAMAGLIVAQPVNDSTMAGIAPDATVLPVRVVGKQPKASATDCAAAIGAAVAAGATVVALGSYVDLNTTEVAEAVTAAVDKDVVVVAGAALGSNPVNPKASIGDGVLRVGGIGMDGQPAADYRKGGIDVVAPGVNVSSVGITGTGSVAISGTQYAVAFAAGQAALVRAAYPDLTPKQVKHRIQKTAEKMSDGQVPDGQFGWGLISPAAAVTEVLPEEADATDSGTGKHAVGRPVPVGHETTLLVIVALVALVAATLLAFRIRRLLRSDDPDGPHDEPEVPADSGFDDPPSGPPAPDGSEHRTVSLAAGAGGGLQRPHAQADQPANQPAIGGQRAKDDAEPAVSAMAGELGDPGSAAGDKAAAGAKSAGARTSDE